MAVESLIDTGATGVALPYALTQRLDLKRGPALEIVTAIDVIPGHLATLVGGAYPGPAWSTRVGVVEHTDEPVDDSCLLCVNHRSFLRLSGKQSRLFFPSLTPHPFREHLVDRGCSLFRTKGVFDDDPGRYRVKSAFPSHRQNVNDLVVVRGNLEQIDDRSAQRTQHFGCIGVIVTVRLNFREKSA